MTTVSSPRIKICGICNVKDAQLAVRYGAKYIGLIFVQSSPRYIQPIIAESIAQAIGNKAQIVGVFQNSSLEEIESIASLVGLDYLQLHGQESPALCNSLSKPVIKVFELQADEKPEEYLTVLESYRADCQYFLFDKPKRITNANWLDIAIRGLKSLEPSLPEYFLAGGLNASNVQKVLCQLRPSVLDIASGVEQTTRTKSESLIAEFCSRISTQNTQSASCTIADGGS